MPRKILFLTGTRADFGKLKPLILAAQNLPDFEVTVFVTGMHTLARYGSTVIEVRESGVRNIYEYINQYIGEPMDLTLANTIDGFAKYVHERTPDLIVVHGDRLEALAGAIVGSFRNIKVLHIEGGEVSGTIDGHIRHAVSKLAHLHMVANEGAAVRLVQMGELRESIWIIGSPDLDLMLSGDLPSLPEVMDHYDIQFERYGILLFHSVTTELDKMSNHAAAVVSAVLRTGRNFVVIYPNNDQGCDAIFDAYRDLEDHPRFRIFASIRFERFLTLLKNADFILGNSSAGIREAPALGVPTVNIGSRQEGRFLTSSIVDTPPQEESILRAMAEIDSLGPVEPINPFGPVKSVPAFIDSLRSEGLWGQPLQKWFVDVDLA